MYKVIKYFTDLQDNNHAYEVGDSFPRDGFLVSQERLDELSSAANRQGIPLIEQSEAPPVVEAEDEKSEKTAGNRPKKKTAKKPDEE